MMVRQERAGEYPKSRGPGKNMRSKIWNLMKGAFVSFLKIEQASGATQSTKKKLALPITKCINKEGV